MGVQVFGLRVLGGWGTKTPVIDADCKEIVGIPLRQMLRDHCIGIILKSSL